MNCLHIIIKRRVFLMALLIATAMISCTDNFSEINTDPNSLAQIGPAELPFLFTRAQDAVNWGGQVEQNLFADQYAQYVANNASYFPTDQYEIEMDWARSVWENHFVQTLPQLQTIMEKTEPTSGEYALALLWTVYSAHRVTDYWGPMPYFNAGIPGKSVPYDSQDKIYDDFFKKLDAAVTVLKGMQGKNVFGNYDIIYGGNVDKWVKFANTLRLRLAVRISAIDPSRAKTEAEAAYSSGVFEVSPDDDALALNSIQDVNSISQMSEWNEFRMSAAMESVLKGMNDPRLPVYWLPAKNTGTFEGLRNGLNSVQLADSRNSAKANSHIGPRWTAPASGGVSDYLTTPSNVMCTAEAYFLRAEGALLGWNMGGTVKELYEAGITHSMHQWGITDQSVIDAYLASTATPIPPDDFLDSPALSDVPVLFNTGDQAIQLEQVALQKWIALFPDGMEGWADYRRRPAIGLYPVASSNNPDIPDPTKQYIRRLPFLTTEYQSNKEETEAAVNLLKIKEDKISTPLWWDVH